MSEETIYNIIDDIAHDAKVIIGEHLHPERGGIVDALKQSAKDWSEVTEEMKDVFRNLEDDLREYCEKHCADNGKPNEYNIGDEVVFIAGGTVVKDRIARVLVETKTGYRVYLDDAFRSMTELVEHLKDDVDG
jgi:hypothetical protein